MSEIAGRTCQRCDGKGWYWRVPEGFNPFYAGGFSTARAMFKATCNCAAFKVQIAEHARAEGRSNG